MMKTKEELQRELYAIRDNIIEGANNSYSLAKPYFKLRDIIEFYFPDSFYINEIQKIPHTYDDNETLMKAGNILLGIVEGLLKRIDSEDFRFYNNNNKEFESVLLKSEALAREIELEREKSERYYNEIRHLSENLENERILMEERYKGLSKVELLKQEDIFIKAAEINKFYSWFWLGGIILSIAGLIFLLQFFVKEFCLDMSCLMEQQKNCPNCGNLLLAFELTRSTIYRIAVISLSVYLVVFVIKNYNALMHNFTVNSQKANSFAASFVMMNAATTEKAKNDIMTQAAQAIFSHQTTGYLGKDNEPSNPLIVEKVVERVLGKGKDD